MQQLFQNLRIKRIIKYDLIEKWNVEFAEKIYLQDKFKNYGQHEIHKNNKGKHYCRSSTRRHERHLWSLFRNKLDFLHRVCQSYFDKFKTIWTILYHFWTILDKFGQA